MKLSNLFKLLSLIVVVVLSACSMEKRVYNTGYHINWNKNINTQNLAHNSKEVNKLNTIETKQSVINNTEKSVYTPTVSKNETEIASTQKSATQNTKHDRKVNFKNPINKISEKHSAKSNAYSTKGESKDNTADEDIPFWVLVLLCFVLPPLAVGFVTNWEMTPLLINVILTLLCGIPGVIHALIVVLEKGKR